MKTVFNYAIFFYVTSFFCQTGTLKPIISVNDNLKEVSAIETIKGSALFWVIEDAGNANTIYGIDDEGNIARSIKVDNVENDDWEDLTHDLEGNIYIGDFGNNSKKRQNFSILKLAISNSSTNTIAAKKINFTLPKKMKSKDFESFFLLHDNFYIFSKEKKKGVILKVPNTIGNHVAELISEFKLKGKKTKITSADVSLDGKTIVLLNHDKVWRLTDFKADKFFCGKVETIEFKHISQKEGVCFNKDGTLYITDERKKSKGGKIYKFTF